MKKLSAYRQVMFAVQFYKARVDEGSYILERIRKDGVSRYLYLLTLR